MGLISNPTVVDYGPLLRTGGKVQVPSDLDGIYEQHWHFLIFECKWPGNQKVSVGQRILLEKQARLPFHTVFLVMLSGARTERDALKFEPIAYMRLGERCKYQWIPTDLERFIELLYQWEFHAKKTPTYSRFFPYLGLPEIPVFEAK